MKFARHSWLVALALLGVTTGVLAGAKETLAAALHGRDGLYNAHPHAPRAAIEHRFYAEPLDPEPLGERTPVVLVHGFHSGQSHLPFHQDVTRDWDHFRGHPQYMGLFERAKFYRFTYRPYAHMRDVGGWLAGELRSQLFPEMAEGRKILLLAISAGALVSRYAAAHEDIAPRVGYIFTLNGANRGSVLSSMAEAKPAIKERIGKVFEGLLRWSRKGVRVSPGMRSLAYDSFDGSIKPEEEERFGMMVNHELRAFNESDPNLHKLIAYQSRPKSLLGKGAFGVDAFLRRRILRSYHPTWKTADPIIHKRSGLLEGAKILARRFFIGPDHSGAAGPVMIGALYKDLDQVLRALRRPVPVE